MRADTHIIMAQKECMLLVREAQDATQAQESSNSLHQGKEIHLIWVFRNRQNLTPDGGGMRESTQEWDEAWVLGSSSKEAFVLLLLASLIVYFLV